MFYEEYEEKLIRGPCKVRDMVEKLLKKKAEDEDVVVKETGEEHVDGEEVNA